MTISRTHLAHLAAIVTVCIWGVTFVNTKCLLNEGLNVTEIFFVRFLIAYICTWFISPRKLWSNNMKDELIFVALGITGGSLYFVTENMAVGLTLVNNVSFIVCTAPLLTVFLAWLVTKSVRLNRWLLAGSLIALLGVGIVIFNGHFVLQLNPAGDLLALAASLCWAIYSILIRKVSGRYGAVFVTRKVFAYGVLTILPFFAIEPFNISAQLLAKPIVWGNVLFLGLVASFLCFVVWSWAIKQIGALKTSNYVYLNPVTTVVASFVVLGESITWLSAIGSLLILIGVYLANCREIEK